MISVERVTKSFGPVLAVDDISFQVGKGEIVGFLGRNGAGKTTTIRILTTYLPATTGIDKVAGYDVMLESMDVRRNIGYLPESVPLYGEMRVDEYLLYRAKLKGVDRKERNQRIDYCLDRCRIREVRRRQMGTLSKGYRQRVGLADSLVHDPPILIFDEPTAGLDPVQIRETLHMIKELGEQHTILFSNHILSEVEAICQRIIIIHRGRIGLDKKVTDLANDRRTIVVEVRGPREPVLDLLRSMDGVAEVSAQGAGDPVSAFDIRTHKDRDLREEIATRITKNGWGIRRLDLRRRRLEDLFDEVVLYDRDPFEGASPPVSPPSAPETAVTNQPG